jgi:hypothetical protein
MIVTLAKTKKENKVAGHFLFSYLGRRRSNEHDLFANACIVLSDKILLRHRFDEQIKSDPFPVDPCQCAVVSMIWSKQVLSLVS